MNDSSKRHSQFLSLIFFLNCLSNWITVEIRVIWSYRRTSKDGTQYVVARYHPPGNIVGEFRDNVKPGDVEALIASRRRSSCEERPRRFSRRRRSSRSGSNPNIQHDRGTKLQNFKENFMWFMTRNKNVLMYFYWIFSVSDPFLVSQFVFSP